MYHYREQYSDEGQTYSSKLQEGANTNPKGGATPYYIIGIAFSKGGKTPPGPPEINSEWLQRFSSWLKVVQGQNANSANHITHV